MLFLNPQAIAQQVVDNGLIRQPAQINTKLRMEPPGDSRVPRWRAISGLKPVRVVGAESPRLAANSQRRESVELAESHFLRRGSDIKKNAHVQIHLSVGVPATDEVLKNWHRRLEVNAQNTNLLWNGSRVALMGQAKSGDWIVCYAHHHGMADDFSEVPASDLRVVADADMARMGEVA